MKELNFRPKGMARNLKQVEIDKSIGLIVKDLIYPFYAAVAMGVKEYANEKGYLVFITNSENLHEREVKFSQLFSNKDIKGAIIAPIVEGAAEIEHLFKLKMINYPFVLLENVKGIQANVVSIDNSKAMKIAVKYLVDSGHTRIVHFAGPESSSHAQERIDGFRSAFSECHLIFEPEMNILNALITGAHYFLCMVPVPRFICGFSEGSASGFSGTFLR
jgi:LacI family transcriptional regulator/LacI family repressor for deo operon, udp, cdd, tsx, nupC, and nupG